MDVEDHSKKGSEGLSIVEERGGGHQRNGSLVNSYDAATENKKQCLGVKSGKTTEAPRSGASSEREDLVPEEKTMDGYNSG